MPTYEYACSDCKISFDCHREVEERNNLPNCPDCGKIDAVRKVINATPTHFKGSGFYSTGG